MDEIFINNLLPLLSFIDLVHFGYACRKFALLVFKKYKLRMFRLEPGYALYDHQIKTIQWMLHREATDHCGIRGGIVGLTMGLGKTLTSLMFALMKYRKSETPTLIVTSKTVMSEWRLAIKQFLGDRVKVIYLHKDYMGSNVDRLLPEHLKRVPLVITTYDMVSSIGSKKGYAERAVTRDEAGRIVQIDIADDPSKKNPKGLNLIFTTKWNRIITDESQRFNNPKTIIYRSIMAVCAKYRWCLTGTPVRNKDRDMFSLMRFMGYTNCKKAIKWQPRMFVDDNLTRCIMTMSYEDAKITIGKKKEDDIYIDMDPNEKLCYEQFAEKARASYRGMILGSVDFMAVLVLFLKMRQCCVAPYLVCKESKRGGTYTEEDKEVAEGLDKLTNGMGTWIHRKVEAGLSSSKIKTVVEIVASLNEAEKIIIFSMFTSALDLIEEAIRNSTGFKCTRVDGSVKGHDRDSELYDFKTKPEDRILLMTYKTGSEGLNLTAATHVICLEPWWTPAVEDQAIARAWRNGQKKTVTIHRIIAKNTIEDTMIKMMWERKRKIANGYVEGTKMPRITKDDLAKILGF